MTRKLYFIDSCFDKKHDATTTDISAHVCMQCVHHPRFINMRALRMHCRVKHNMRNDMRLYAGADCICQCCQNKYSTRLRLLSHLSDGRRTRCTSWILTHGVPFEAHVLDLLEQVDSKARSDARKKGLSQPLSTAPALHASGRKVGRAFTCS